eukprot:GFYU01002161.1.p1 GENE.GFYU01002161.1~~GFYU01002161.1.p1  ORF type:complete len:165 (+),score=35.29 GFYU01002161.1:530-1024(+)
MEFYATWMTTATDGEKGGFHNSLREMMKVGHYEDIKTQLGDRIRRASLNVAARRVSRGLIQVSPAAAGPNKVHPAPNGASSPGAHSNGSGQGWASPSPKAPRKKSSIANPVVTDHSELPVTYSPILSPTSQERQKYEEQLHPGQPMMGGHRKSDADIPTTFMDR